VRAKKPCPESSEAKLILTSFGAGIIMPFNCRDSSVGRAGD
jgi:hypothetical protein